MRDPYKDLGVDKDSNVDEIKSAYKKKVQETHPDKEGGNREEFDKVQEAYLVLRDPEKRKHYDEHGTAKKEKKEMHVDIIASLFEQLLSKDDLPYNFDYVATVKDSLEQIHDEATSKLKIIDRQIEKLGKLKNKFHRKNKKGRVKTVNEPLNFFRAAIESKIAGLEIQFKNGEELKVNVTRALEIIDDYEFEIDKSAMPNRSTDMEDAFRYAFHNFSFGKKSFKDPGSS